MRDVPRILGAVVAEIAFNLLRRESDAGRPALRITGFSHDEVVEITSCLDHLQAEHGGHDLVVKVGTSQPVAGIDPIHLLGRGETLTSWRNRPAAAAAPKSRCVAVTTRAPDVFMASEPRG